LPSAPDLRFASTAYNKPDKKLVVFFDSLNTEDTAALPEHNQYTQYKSVELLRDEVCPPTNPNKCQQANTKFVLWPNPFFKVFSQPKEPS